MPHHSLSTTSVQQVLQTAAQRLAVVGVPSPDSDVKLLLAHAWHTDLAGIARKKLLGESVPDEVAVIFERLLTRREQRIPLQHLTGYAAFRHVELAVGPGAFIPRPETEILVDQVLEYLSSQQPLAQTRPLIVDLCTGTAAIALAIATEVPGCDVIGVEISAAAMHYAAENVRAYHNQLQQVDSTCQLLNADATAPLQLPRPATVVVSNPPYVPAGAVPVEPEVAQHDPALALYGGGDSGLDIPAALVKVAVPQLAAGGLIVFEHADVQGETMRELFSSRSELKDVQTITDYTGRDRVCRAIKRLDPCPDVSM